MPPSRALSLHRFVYRVLTIRLLCMAAVIALLTAGVVYMTEQRQLRDQVVADTRIEMDLLVSRTMDIIATTGMDRLTAFRRALDERVAVRTDRENGRYVFVSFSSLDGPDIEERRDSGYDLAEAVDRFVASQAPIRPASGKWSEIVMLAERLHVHVGVPLLDPDRQRVGTVQAIFAPSEQARAALRTALRRAVGLSVLIVLATCSLLYPVIVHLVAKLTRFSRNLLEANLDTLTLLASAIAKRDSDTDAHNFRVTLYAVRLAETMGVADDQIQSLIKGAFLHDVGKIGIPDAILLKEGRLSEEEYGLMRQHVRHGVDIIGGSEWLRDAMAVVEAHHEQFNGSGYPQGRIGEAIPLLARIFAVVDVFDALTSQRPYKEPLSFEASMTILQQASGTHFDPAVLAAFTTIAPELYRRWAGREDQGIRDDLKAVLVRSFSDGAMVLY